MLYNKYFEKKRGFGRPNITWPWEEQTLANLWCRCIWTSVPKRGSTWVTWNHLGLSTERKQFSAVWVTLRMSLSCQFFLCDICQLAYQMARSFSSSAIFAGLCLQSPAVSQLVSFCFIYIPDLMFHSQAFTAFFCSSRVTKPRVKAGVSETCCRSFFWPPLKPLLGSNDLRSQVSSCKNPGVLCIQKHFNFVKGDMFGFHHCSL